LDGGTISLTLHEITGTVTEHERAFRAGSNIVLVVKFDECLGAIEMVIGIPVDGDSGDIRRYDGEEVVRQNTNTVLLD
jgi:hypothetical protein